MATPTPAPLTALGPAAHDVARLRAQLHMSHGPVDRVTKARFEALHKEMAHEPGSSSPLRWGVVHLYREPDEHVVTSSGDETRRRPTVTASTVPAGGLMDDTTAASLPTTNHEPLPSRDGDGHTILCIPAVPSYLTPHDFLDFVGEDTCAGVSHFRLVLTPRADKYLALIKFRRDDCARRWQREWDGRVFNTMEPETCEIAFIKTITYQNPVPTSSTTRDSTNFSFPTLSHDPFMPVMTSTDDTGRKAVPLKAPPSSDLPTCPVCLERMDDTSTLLTIACQHVFHCMCLRRWRGAGCPVCRRTNASSSWFAFSTAVSPGLAIPPETPLPQDGGNSSSSNRIDSGQDTRITDASPARPVPATTTTDLPCAFGSGAPGICSTCEIASDLWICLTCGNVGCGRYKNGHAKEHWKRSAHIFALEIETQYVWDYADDVWVHRLIRGKEDKDEGHGQQQSIRSRGDKGDDESINKGTPRKDVSTCTLGNRTHDVDDSPEDAQHFHGEEMVPMRKLEAMSVEYTTLLTQQLESQRLYYGAQLSSLRQELSTARTRMSADAAEHVTQAEDLRQLRTAHISATTETIPALERDLARERRRADKATDLARSVTRALADEKLVAEGLLARVKWLGEQVGKLEEQRAAWSGEKAELEEQMRDLMFAIGGAQRIRELEGEGEEDVVGPGESAGSSAKMKMKTKAEDAQLRKTESDPMHSPGRRASHDQAAKVEEDTHEAQGPSASAEPLQQPRPLFEKGEIQNGTLIIPPASKASGRRKEARGKVAAAGKGRS